MNGCYLYDFTLISMLIWTIRLYRFEMMKTVHEPPLSTHFETCHAHHASRTVLLFMSACPKPDSYEYNLSLHIDCTAGNGRIAS